MCHEAGRCVTGVSWSRWSGTRTITQTFDEWTSGEATRDGGHGLVNLQNASVRGLWEGHAPHTVKTNCRSLGNSNRGCLDVHYIRHTAIISWNVFNISLSLKAASHPCDVTCTWSAWPANYKRKRFSFSPSSPVTGFTNSFSSRFLVSSFSSDYFQILHVSQQTADKFRCTSRNDSSPRDVGFLSTASQLITR